MKKIKSRKFRTKRLGVLKCLGIIGLVFIVFGCSSYVDAGDYDSVIEKKRINDIYAVAIVDGKTRIFYLNMYEMNGRIAYCIDLGVDITTSIYHSTNDFSVSYLSDDQIEYIRSISYFGYQYENHEDYKYYMAAQELIWEYLGSSDVEWTNELNVDRMRINIDSYKDEILNLRNLYNRNLDLEWIDGQTYKVGQDIIIKDNNGVLSDYEVVSSKYSDVSIVDNNLLIKMNNVINEDMIELRRKGYYDYDTLLYYYDNSQRLISNGNYKKVDKVLNFNIEGVSLNVQVVDMNSGINRGTGEATLKEAVYELYNERNDLVGIYTTDANGFFKVENLLLGNYYILQKEASEGYLLNKSKVTFTVSEDNFKLELKQEVIKNSIVINKVYGSNGYYKPEDKISFFVYDRFGDVRAHITTNNMGYVLIDLPYGSYKFKQLNTTSGYSMVEDFIVEVKEQKDDRIHYNLVNELILVKVKVITLNKDNGDNIILGGFSYKIREKDKNTYMGIDGKDIFTTDDNGNLLIPIMLGYGDYILEQINVPDGILLNSEFQEFSINDNSNLSLVNGNLVMNVNFYNEFVMGKVEVLATEEKFYKNTNDYGYEIGLRSDSEFTLIANEDIVVNGELIYKDKEKIYSILTDENGSFTIENLHLGSYCLVDEDTIEEKCFILKSVDEKTKIVEENIEFFKSLEKGNIIIHNISNNGENIYGTIFEVIDNEGTVIYTGVTNNDGIIKVPNLLLDNYCINQKKVAFNYQANNEEKCFLLDGDNQVDFVNDLIVNEVVKVPNTLSKDIGFYELVVIFTMIGTGVFVYKKIFASKLYR